MVESVMSDDKSIMGDAKTVTSDGRMIDEVLVDCPKWNKFAYEGMEAKVSPDWLLSSLPQLRVTWTFWFLTFNILNTNLIFIIDSKISF